WNCKRYSKVRFPSMSEGGFFESDNETQCVGVQLSVTNETDDPDGFVRSVTGSGVSLTTPGLTLLADGTSDDITMHARSKYSHLESVSPEETVEATLLHTASPQTFSYTLEAKEGSQHTYSIKGDEDLEIRLTELNAP
ncbi:MAG: hypothetical protein J07HX5_01061, partial [halophilic archaeon J07HX5]